MKLTAGMKASIACGFTDAHTKTRRQELRTQLKCVGTKIYDALIPVPVQKKMAALPDGYFAESSSLAVCFSGSRMWTNVDMLSARRIPEFLRYGSSNYGLDDPVLIDEFQAATAALSAHDKKTKALRAECDRLLAGISTDTKLKEVWPEGYEFLGTKSDRSVPVLTADGVRLAVKVVEEATHQPACGASVKA